MDPLLHPFLESPSESDAQLRLEDLMRDHVEPAIRQVLQRRIRLSPGRTGTQSPEQNLEDILAEARLNVLRTLRQLKEKPQQSIQNFEGYVRAIADQAWDQQLRRMFPQRWRLKNQLRYLLSHHPDFGLWRSTSGEMVAGKSAWKGREAAAGAVPLDTDVRLAGRKGTDRLVQLLCQAFQESGAPLEIEGLVNSMEKWLGTSDSGTLEDQGDPELLERLQDQRDTTQQRIENRMFLRRLWDEIVLLPERQRMAILFGLRDASGYPLAPLLPLLEVVSKMDIAVSLNLSSQEFAALWNQLPMDDRAIARYLQITPQQVINLRKCARQRLGRKMRRWGGRGNIPNKLSSTTDKGE